MIQAAHVTFQVILGQKPRQFALTDYLQARHLWTKIAQGEAHHAARIGNHAPGQGLFVVVIFGGDKTGQGFYKKTKNAKGETEILTLDLKTFEYKPKAKAKFATLETTKTIDNLKDRFKVLLAGKDKAGERLAHHRLQSWRPHGDSNPGSHRERVVS